MGFVGTFEPWWFVCYFEKQFAPCSAPIDKNSHKANIYGMFWKIAVTKFALMKFAWGEKLPVHIKYPTINSNTKRHLLYIKYRARKAGCSGVELGSFKLSSRCSLQVLQASPPLLLPFHWRAKMHKKEEVEQKRQKGKLGIFNIHK